MIGKLWNIKLILRLGSFWINCYCNSNHNSYYIALIPCIIVKFQVLIINQIQAYLGERHGF